MLFHGHGEMVQVNNHDFEYVNMVQWCNGTIILSLKIPLKLAC